MSRFIVDTQLPISLCKYLRNKGHDTIHTFDCPNQEYTEDKEISEIAKNENRIIITKDSDFHDAYLVKGAPPRILLLRFGNCSNRELISIFDKHFDKANSYFEMQNENFVMIWRDFLAII